MAIIQERYRVYWRCRGCREYVDLCMRGILRIQGILGYGVTVDTV